MPTRRSAMGDGGHLVGVRGSSDSGHSYRNQIRCDDLRVFANSTDYRSGTESTSGRWSRGGAIVGGSGARCYAVLGHETASGRHGEMAELTTSRVEGCAASGKPSKHRLTAAAAGERKNARGRLNPGKSRPKRGIYGTYGRGGVRRSSRRRRRRGLGTGVGNSPVAVASFERDL